MSNLLCNVLKISGVANAPNAPPWLRAWCRVCRVERVPGFWLFAPQQITIQGSGMSTQVHVPPPESFDFNFPDNWSLRGWNVSKGTGRLLLFMRKRQRNRWICLCIYLAAKGEDVLSSFNLTNEEVEKYSVVVARFNTYFNVRTNMFYERAVFNRINQNDSDSVDNFITRLILKLISVVMAICGMRWSEIEL